MTVRIGRIARPLATTRWRASRARARTRGRRPAISAARARAATLTGSLGPRGAGGNARGEATRRSVSRPATPPERRSMTEATGTPGRLQPSRCFGRGPECLDQLAVVSVDVVVEADR